MNDSDGFEFLEKPDSDDDLDIILGSHRTEMLDSKYDIIGSYGKGLISRPSR